MAGTAADMLKVARRDIGVKESPPGSNKCKFTRWYGLVGPWCAMAVSYWARQAGVPKDVIPTHAYTPDGRNFFRNKGQYHKKPKAGDIVYYQFPGFARVSHVGIVETVHSDGSWTALEGNGLPLGTPILTPTGFVPVGQVEVGDQVIDPDGLPSQVTGVFPQGTRPCYQITFSDGRTIIADENHRWRVTSRWSKRAKIMTTAELASTRQRYTNARITVPPRLEGETPSLDGWALGALIGDGCLTQGKVKLAASDTYMQSRATDALGVPTTDVKDNSAYGYKPGVTLAWPKAVAEKVDAVGLLGKSWEEKRIPDAVFTAPADYRLQVLQGLMDTDGTCDTVGRASYSSSNRDLIEDVQRLIWSLGGTCGITEHHPGYTLHGTGERRQGRDAWRCSNVRMPVNPFTRPAKAERYVTMPERKQIRGWGIDSIERVADAETVCISVSAPSALYVTKDYIVTHNTDSSGSRTGGQVMRKRRRSVGSLGGFGRPNYAASKAKPKTSTPAPKPKPAGKLDVDGSFGPATIKALQRALKVKPDGAFGPATKKALQKLLKVAADGSVGPQTVRALQKRLGVKADGAWGKDTTKALQRALNEGKL